MKRQRRNSMQRSFVSGGVYDPRVQFQQQQQQQPQYLPREVPPPPQLNINEDSKYINPEPPVLEPQPIPIVDQINQSANSAEITGGDGEDGDGQERKGYFKKSFGIRKKPSIRAKEKKIRQNRRLRKVLLPKNALMALHEVKNIRIEDFIISNNLSGGFTATVSVNNVQYEGAGNSKNAAKNNACEKALRDLVIMKMNQKPVKPQKLPNENQMDDNESIIGSTGGGTSVAGDEDIQMKDGDDTDEDELPMLNLASFALFKLFSEWEAAGFEVPEFRPASHLNGNNSDAGSSIMEKPKKIPNVRTELPPNWETMHPATLLCMMRPGITYVDDGCEGQPPNIIQKMGVTIESEHYVGSGRSKKIARKNAAVIACNKLYGTKFPIYDN